MWGVFDRSAIIDTLNDFAKMCRQRHVRLFVMFNPMPWHAIANDENLKTAEIELTKFQNMNPDVIFLTQQLVVPWDPAKFGMYNHVSRDSVHESSGRMGRALEKAIYTPESMMRFHPAWRPQEFPFPRNIKKIGLATEVQKNAALAYFLYTATFDPTYEKHMSGRVRAELLGNTDFRLLKEDEEARLEYLAKKKITLDYDTSQINAEVVTLQNGIHPSRVHNTKWIRLSGIMQFGLHSPTHNVIEPVVWPEESNIIIPVIEEGNGYKYDGYFPSYVD